MLRASKAIVCALFADVATLSSAARTQLSTEDGSGAARVMSRIGALLQARGGANEEVLTNLRLLALQKITPGATDSLNEALTKVIGQLETNVESKIKSGHEDAQTALNTAIDALSGATTNAVNEKVAADRIDGAWYDCVRDEKVKRVKIEQAEEELQQSRSSQIEPCQQQEDRKGFESQVLADTLQFECDISTHGNCDAQMENYVAQIESMLSGVRAEVQAAEESWTEAKNACDAAKADVVAKQSSLSDATSAWHDARSECQEKHETRHVTLCIFGKALQRKCGKVTAYHELVTETETENGGAHSHPDRVAEWKAVAATKCMLSKVIDGVELDATTLDVCETAIDYGSDVGVLAKGQGEFAELTTPAKFTCNEATITFSGETWEVPTGEAPASSEYISNPFAPEVVLDEDSSPFAFCSVDAPPPEEDGPGKDATDA